MSDPTATAAKPPARAHYDLGLLIVRLALGGLFVVHGYQKAVLNGIAATQQGFTQMGAPLPELTGVLVILLELVGGALLVLGIASRLIALLLVAEMVGALLLVHLPNGFFVADNGWELVGLLGAVSLALVVAGPGRISLDHAFFGRRRARRRAEAQPAAV